MKLFVKHIFLVLFSTVLIIGINSCSEGEDSPSPNGQEESFEKDQLGKRAVEVLKALPEIRISQGPEGKNRNTDKNDGFNFGDPPEGFDFSDPQGTAYATEDGIVIVTTPGFGSNTGGGVITAGSSSYDISQTFCLSSEEEDEMASGISSIAGATDFEGVSLILGVSGDLDMASIDTTQLFGGLEAIVLYVVFDSEAQGSYDVINFFDLEELGDEPEGVAFAYIIDIENSRIYISSDGELNVSGGSISFSGEYLQLDFEDDAFFDDIIQPEQLKFVSGAGTLGC